MRKLFALGVILSALIFPAMSLGATSEIQLYVNGTALIPEPSIVTDYEPAVYSGDTVLTPEVIGTVEFPAVSGRNYTFDTVTNALDFATNAETYIDTNYTGIYKDNPSYDVTYDSSLQSPMTEITVSIETGTIDYEVDLTPYTAITDLTFTATPRTITVSTAGDRHFIAGNTSNVSFVNITFSGNNNGGGVTASNGNVTFSGCVFNNCYTSGNGGGVSVSGGTAAFTNTTFTGCNADSNGGGLSVSGGAVSISSGSSFSGNNAYSGGGLSITGGSVSMDNATFSGNDATNGGAVYSSAYLAVGAGVKFNTVSLSAPNIAEKGGAIYVASGTTTISGAQAEFTENRAFDSGGAIYIASGTVNISGSGIAFTENVVSNDGGAIFANAGARVNLTGDSLSFAGNNAESGSGGAIYASGDRTAVTISGATSDFASNVANSGKGGAIVAGGGTTLNISGAATFTTNSAEYGGAIYLAATRRRQTALNITGESEATFTRNSAGTSGGGIYAEQYSQIAFTPTVTFTGNTANDGNGGALWVYEGSQLPEGTVYFNGNTSSKSDTTSTSTGSGGAIYIGGTSASSTTLGSSRKYTFDGNEAASYGGALCTYSSDIIFDGYSVTVENKAKLGGGFAASYNSKITLNNSSISNQTSEGSGGAVWAAHIVSVSSDFGVSGANSSTGTGNHQGGGALYSLGELTLTQSTFTDNTAEQGGGAGYSYAGEMTVTDSIFTGNSAVQGGGALYAEASQVSITNSYFATNTTSSGNGGAVTLAGYCTSSITSSTFRNNTSSKLDGGAIYAQGTVNITLCFLRENKSQRSGGAIYFNQNSDNPSNYSKFTMTSTMLEENSTSGVEGNGGGLYVVANDAAITSCTFSGNRLVLAGNTGEGGGAYIAAQPIQNEDVEIINCTFYDNHIDDGAEGSSGGGGLSVHCEKTTIVKSCTFSVNGSQYKGGAIYLGDGSKLQLSGTIMVGNTDEGTYDIWSDGNISSGGYNRIGVYGTGTGVTDFYSETRNDTDRTAYPNKSWTRSTFFSNNTLAVNERTDLGSNIPPYLGSTLSSRTRLMTLMLSEDAALPLIDRATNIIPYTRRGMFPTTDERGVARISQGSQIALDVGACFFDGTRASSEDRETASYTISSLEISGIPNNLRRVGQTASLIAKIYYTNGRTALGGNGTDEEPVEWTSDKPNIIRINKDTGDITVLSFTPGETYVTITAATIRGNLSGERVYDQKPIKVTEYTYSYLNTSPEIMDYLQGYVQQLTEYDISLQLADVSSSMVSSSSFQSSFANIWGNITARQITDLTNAALTFDTVKSYTASDGYTLAPGKAGVNVNFEGLKEGDIFPLTYSWTFSGAELQGILGYDMSGKNVSGSESEMFPSISGTLADEIFSELRIDFKGVNSSWPIIGTGGVKASEAISAGALKLTTADGGRGINAELTAYLANVTALGVNDGPQIVKSSEGNLLIVPDGTGNDGKIYGSVVMAVKPGSSQSNGTKTGTQGNTGNTGNQTGAKGSSGGGGCEAFGVILPAIALIFMAGRKSKH